MFREEGGRGKLTAVLSCIMSVIFLQNAVCFTISSSFYFRISTFLMNGSPELPNTHVGGIKVKTILHGPSPLSPADTGTCRRMWHEWHATVTGFALFSGLCSCAPEVLSRVLIILFEMPIRMIFCSFGCVCTSALTCALRLSSCLCDAETSDIFRVFKSFLESISFQRACWVYRVLYKSYFIRENFECGIDGVSVGNLTQVELATAWFQGSSAM